MSESSRHIDYAAAARAAEREAIRDRAAQWSDMLRHRGGRPEIREDFERWRDARPEHAEIFDRIDATHELARAVRDTEAMAEIERDTLRRIAARRARKRLKTFAAAASVVVAVLAGLAVTEPVRNELNYWADWTRYALAGDSLYRTAIGEQRTIELADGSELTLNTNSRAAVQFAGTQPTTRAVTLLQGQALFEVAHDETRPFVVTAGNRKITALGTAFDVRLTERELEVVLIEGRVKVEDNPSPQPSPRGGEGATLSENSPLSSGGEESSVSPLPLGGEGQGEGGSSRTTNNDHFDRTRKDGKAGTAAARRGPHMDVRHQQQTTVLQPGEQLIVATTGPALPIVRQTDTRLATSWHDGQLIFRNDRLAEAVEEVNRYSKRKIVLADESLADLRVSGIVNTGNTAVFVETMTNYYPVAIVDQTRNQVTLGPRRG